jgi:hypothetical protein
MKKLKLELDTLAVDSFATAEDAAAMRGTMQAQEAAVTPLCLTGTETYTCPVVGTCVVCTAGG